MDFEVADSHAAWDEGSLNLLETLLGQIQLGMPMVGYWLVVRLRATGVRVHPSTKSCIELAFRVCVQSLNTTTTEARASGVSCQTEEQEEKTQTTSNS